MLSRQMVQTVYLTFFECSFTVKHRSKYALHRCISFGKDLPEVAA